MKMHFYMMLIFLMFYSGFQVNGQFSMTDVTGSGDGLNESSTYSRLPLIDDNGDLSTIVTDIDGFKNLDETEANFTDTTLFSTGTSVDETTAEVSVNDTFTDSTIMQNSQTTTATDHPTTDLASTDTVVDSTTSSVLIVSSTTETTTQEDTTTEEDSTTTESTTTTKTKRPIKTDSATEMSEPEYTPKQKDMATKNLSTAIPAVSTVSVDEDAGKQCVFMDASFHCDLEVICYGDGEIDCTDDDEMDADYSDVVDEMHPSFPDYDNITEGESNPLAARQLFFNSQKINLFKMFPLIPTSNESSSEEMTMISNPSSNFTMPLNEELIDVENVEMNDTTMNTDDTESILDAEVYEKLDSFFPPTESAEAMSYNGELSSFDDNLLNTASSEELEGMLLENNETITTFSDITDTEKPLQVNETIPQDYVINETSTEGIVVMTTDSMFENETEKEVVNQPIIVRSKREKNLNSNYKVSELEGSQKKINPKACKLNGNIVCIPSPTRLTCSGKTLCQVTPQAIETVEKPAEEKGFEKWTISVIIICAITATATIILLVYLVFTSYKKLKVQPQNEVTTLNYVNNAQP